MEVTAKDLFDLLIADKKVTLWIEESKVANLHIQLCKYRKTLDDDFNAIGAEHGLIAARESILLAKAKFSHTEDGTKFCEATFSIGERKRAMFTIISGPDNAA